MNEPLFAKLGAMLKLRRPGWKCVIEDTTIRVLTNQFMIEWPIFKEMEALNYEIRDVMLHQQYGVVVTMNTKQGV